MIEKLVNHYDEMWSRAVKSFEAGKFELDPFLDSIEDNRRGLTLLARPGRGVKSKIVKLQNKLKAIEPDQYYYPESDLHLTILSIISCNQSFKIERISPANYSNVIRQCLRSPFRIELEGITASKSGVLIQGFPVNGELEVLRKQLRTKFQKSQLEHSIDTRYELITAHLTIMRFRTPLTRVNEFVKELNVLRSYELGSMLIDKVYYVHNDWYQRIEKVKELDTFALS